MSLLTRGLALFIVACVVAFPSLGKADQIWDNDDADFDWNNPNNWTSAVPTPAELAIFNGVGFAFPITLGAPQSVLGTSFSNDAGSVTPFRPATR